MFSIFIHLYIKLVYHIILLLYFFIWIKTNFLWKCQLLSLILFFPSAFCLFTYLQKISFEFLKIFFKCSNSWLSSFWKNRVPSWISLWNLRNRSLSFFYSSMLLFCLFFLLLFLLLHRRFLLLHCFSVKQLIFIFERQ